MKELIEEFFAALDAANSLERPFTKYYGGPTESMVHRMEAWEKVHELRKRLCGTPEQLTEDTPMQPIVIDEHGAPRFKSNQIVIRLLSIASNHSGYTLNDIARGEFNDEERMQFAQLIGYSTSGYGDLSYASEDSVQRADAIAEQLIEKAAK